LEVIVGKNAGFCGGVVNSFTKTMEILESNKNVHCLGELVHNRVVVDNLKKLGLKIIDNLDEVMDNSKVIIRAHGVAKSVYSDARKRNIQLYDLTCPKVLKIHEEAERLQKEGYFIVLTAKKTHPEAIGTISFCGENSIIIENINEVDEVVSLIKEKAIVKVAVLSQTTFSVLKYQEITDALKEKLDNKYELVVKNTICRATELRQREVIELAKEVDVMIILGGKNSSNTKKLYELSKDICKDTFIIEDVSDITWDMSSYKRIGLMAGASTPKISIDEVLEYLNKIDV